MATSSNNNNLWKFLSPVVTLLLVIGGFIVSWSTVKATVAEIKNDQVRIEVKVNAHEAKIHEIELRVVGDNATMQSDIGAIKSDIEDIKEILQGQ